MNEKLAADLLDDNMYLISTCIERFNEAASRVGALEVVVDMLQVFKEHSNGNRGASGRILRHFIELADQVRFELEELGAYSNDSVEDYIIDNLYKRAEAYIDIFQGDDVYCRNITARLLTVEDLGIIREKQMSILVPYCISEFYEQPSFRFEILACLIAFDNDELVRFFYEVVKNEIEPDLKIVALLGLCRGGKKFSNWKNLLGVGDDEFDILVRHAAGMKDEKMLLRSMNPDNRYILFFTLLYIDHVLDPELYYVFRSEIFDVLTAASGIQGDSGQLQLRMLHSVKSILGKMPAVSLKKIIQQDDDILILLRILENLPIEIFDKVLRSLHIPREDLARSVEKLVDRNSFSLDDHNSNMLAYLHDEGMDAAL